MVEQPETVTHSDRQFVRELDRELTGRLLDLWRGHDRDGKPLDVPAETIEQYRATLRRGAPKKAGAVARGRVGHFVKPARREGDPHKICLAHHLSAGDSLVMSAAIRSLHLAYPGQYLVDVDCTHGDQLYANNPDVTKLRREDCDFHPINYPLINRSNQEPVHFMQGFAEDLCRIVARPLKLLVNRPVLVLSEEETKWSGPLELIAGSPVPFALILSGGKRDFTAKHIGGTISQEVVDHFAGRVQFVQVGQSNEMHPKLSGVLDLIDRTSIRDLIRVASWCTFAVGPSTLLQHICAAFQRPYIAVLGGREPRAWTAYGASQQDVTSHGCLPCCRVDACWKSRVVPLGDGSEQDRSLCSLPVVMSGGETIPKCIADPGSSAIIGRIEAVLAGGLPPANFVGTRLTV